MHYPCTNEIPFMPSVPIVYRFDGVSNFRDLGGYRTRAGQMVIRNRLFRSAWPTGLTANDRHLMRSLGIKIVCDLRARGEQSTKPAFVEGAITVSIPMVHESGMDIQKIQVESRKLSKISESTVSDLMKSTYAGYIASNQREIRAFFDLLLENSQHPLLFHCRAGKDRTGILAALLLTVLGVEFNLVLQDFVATDECWSGEEDLAKLPDEIRNPLFRADPEYLLVAFQKMRDLAGSPEGYIRRNLALSSIEISRLRAALLVPALYGVEIDQKRHTSA